VIITEMGDEWGWGAIKKYLRRTVSSFVLISGNFSLRFLSICKLIRSVENN
jgi:hypothetical protein